MLKVSVYNQKGAVVGEQELNPKIFGLAPNNALVHQVVVALEANARNVVAHTKTRGEVSGGGKKPWRQKGTGRARHGSIRSPLWRGGGVIFGPRPERNYTQKINKKMKQKALFVCLSDKVAHDKFVLVDSFESLDGKTRVFAQFLSMLPCKSKKILVGLAAPNKNVMHSVKNMENIWAADIGSLSVRDVLRYDCVLTTKEGVKKIEEVHSKK